MTLAQAPFLALAVRLTGLPLLTTAILMVIFNTASQPAENALMALYSPRRWQATAYGFKFIITFGISALGIYAAAKAKELTGGFGVVYGGTALAVMLITLAIASLPGQAQSTGSAHPAAEPAPAE
jgi:hypothetical protein